MSWPDVFYGLSLDFGWTPDEIRWLTLDELELYSARIQQRRKTTQPTDVSAEQIRRALFSWFGVKEPPTEEEMEKRFKEAANVTTSKAAFDAWMAAGNPSPAIEWIKNWDKNNG